jgi:hypothetical protein
VTVSATAPMTGSYDHLQMAPSVLLAVPRPTPYSIFPNPFAFVSGIILINFSYKNCWSAASARATCWREVPC